MLWAKEHGKNSKHSERKNGQAAWKRLGSYGRKGDKTHSRNTLGE